MAATNAHPTAGGAAASGAPARGRVVLTTLILVGAVANLPLAVANVALPSIGVAFNASQTQLTLVAVSYSLGLAVSVLWFGAIGDRYGRKQILLVGMAISVVACIVCAWAPTIQVLIGARFVGGLAAGIALVIGYVLRVTALYRGWEEPLANEPAGGYKHDDGRPLLGRKIRGKSVRELRDLGLAVDEPAPGAAG
jgi:MFS transporter